VYNKPNDCSATGVLAPGPDHHHHQQQQQQAEGYSRSTVEEKKEEAKGGDDRFIWGMGQRQSL
jgi:hypothetical protein